MSELNKLLEENNLSQVDALQYNAIKTVSEKENEEEKKDTQMRTANIRVSSINKINIDNDELGFKAGDTVTYTKEDIIKKIENWYRTKHFSYYMIEHNDDPNNVHYHIVFEFYSNSTAKYSQLKQMFPYGHIVSCKKVRACVQYLIHLNHPEKHQYSWDDVVTNNPARLELYKVQGNYSEDAKLNYILAQIYSGGIKQYEIGSKIDYDIFLKYENKIMRAFRYLNEQKVVVNNRDFQVYVLQGPSRVGKSTFCKCWAKKHKMSIGFSSAGKHPFDEYRGQDCFVIDDNGNSFFSIDDMKKLLDPHNNTGVAARYHNVLFSDCKVLFICTNTPICDWYVTESKEDREAFFKRISYVLDFGNKSEDFTVNYTVNEIIYQGENGTYEYAQNMYHEYKKYALQSVDDIMHTFDLKKYINPANDEEKKKQFLAEIDMI